MGKTVTLETMKAVAKQIDSFTKFKGDRLKSKTDGLILIDFIRKVFEHNHYTIREKRLQDHEIRQLVATEFGQPHYLDPKRNYVAVWRNMFNTGRLHISASGDRAFVAFRVNASLQFTRSTSQRVPLSVEQLKAEYEKQGFKLSKELLNEVKSYPSERSV